MKFTKVERSNRAHNRLFNKHIVIFGSHDSTVKANYHRDVLAIQRKTGSVLSRKDRQLLYRYNRERLFDFKGKPVSSKSYLDLFRKNGVRHH